MFGIRVTEPERLRPAPRLSKEQSDARRGITVSAADMDGGISDVDLLLGEGYSESAQGCWRLGRASLLVDRGSPRLKQEPRQHFFKVRCFRGT